MRRHTTLASLASLVWFFSTGQAFIGRPLTTDKRHFDAESITCNPGGRTYSTESPPQGNYMPWNLMGDNNAVPGSKQYITIVNLTPHRFKLQHTHSYQMDVFDWGDVPQGHARQNTVVYTGKIGKNPVDDNGEAYYSIEGTDKKFMIRATTRIPDANPKRTVFDLSGMGLGQREYLDPAKESPVTLVITGSDDYGFITSIRYGAGNWMKSIYNVIKDRQIQHVVMPGTHDSGMSTISGKILSGGISQNTQTQGINIYNQLRAGARWFDLRIASIHDVPANSYGFWALHVNNELAEVAVGNSGESLDDIISEINKFTAENPGEVIFFRVRYLVGIRKVPSLGPIYWNNDIVNAFFGKLKSVKNRCGNLNTDSTFNQMPVSYFMDQNNGNGCVIFLLAGNLKPDVPQNSISDGIYSASQLKITDNWSNMGDTAPMSKDQATDWKGVSRGGGSDTFHISQWLVSADVITTTRYTIQGIAIKPTNPALYWMGVNNMSPESWPTVILVDYIGTVVMNQNSWEQLSADIYTLAVGLNLYMISENCNVSKIKSPLLAQSNTSFKAVSLDDSWRGIIYANGTVDNNPPDDLHPGRVEILRKGTMFMNGTVLEEDMINPDFNSTGI